MHSQIRNDCSTQGVLTERLGNGLQNRVERFDSARHLEKSRGCVIVYDTSFFCSSLAKSLLAKKIPQISQFTQIYLGFKKNVSIYEIRG